MVAAKPDTTQYQIMRVMKYQDWKHVRVLNLSDIREPKCTTFFKRVKDFENNYGRIHSIFSNEREKERNRAFHLKEKDSPILVAWGCNKSLLDLANRAMTYIVPEKVIGLSYSMTNLYRHPLPSLHKSKIEWLETINLLLNKK